MNEHKYTSLNATFLWEHSVSIQINSAVAMVNSEMLYSHKILLIHWSIPSYILNKTLNLKITQKYCQVFYIYIS